MSVNYFTEVNANQIWFDKPVYLGSDVVFTAAQNKVRFWELVFGHFIKTHF